MNIIFNFYIVGILLLFFACQSKSQLKPPESLSEFRHNKVILGNENFLSNHLNLVKNKRVGLITNPSGVTRRLEFTSDLFYMHPEINLVALFGPEHGIRGSDYGGDKILDSKDDRTQVPLFSLYGKSRKPTSDMMKRIDVLIFDIQDIGVRSYTYIYTMAKSMEACAKNNKPFIVLDRPNPLGGLLVEGNVLDTAFASFVGLYPLPYLHGMTIGELANYFNNEFSINCDLTIIPMQNWKRQMNFGKTGLHWVPTSPHVPDWQTVAYLASTGTIGELHSVSIGVGYTLPFKLIGTPSTNGNDLAKSLNELNLAGVYFRPQYFKPFYGLFKGEICNGVQIHITDIEIFKPYVTGLHIMQQLIKKYTKLDLFANSNRINMFNKVMGTDKIMAGLVKQKSVFEMEQSWQKDLIGFKKKRKKYLLY